MVPLSDLNMDLATAPLNLTATYLPIDANVVKVEPSSQLSQPEDVERGLYRHSSDFVRNLARSLSPCSSPHPPTNAPQQEETNMASPGAHMGEKDNQQVTDREQINIILSNADEPAEVIEHTTVEVYASRQNSNSSDVMPDTSEQAPCHSTGTMAEGDNMSQQAVGDEQEGEVIQPATVEVYASQHTGSSSDVLPDTNLPPSDAIGKGTTRQAVGDELKGEVIQPATVEVYASQHVAPTSSELNQPHLNVVSGSACVNQAVKDSGRERDREGKEGERKSKEVATSPVKDQISAITIHTVSSLADVDSDSSSQGLSHQPGPPNWSDSQKKSMDSDALYNSGDSQPPSLKVIRLESPSPSPDSHISLLLEHMDAQSPQQMDAQSPRLQLDPEHCHTTKEDEQMECSSSGGFLYSSPHGGEGEEERESEGIELHVSGECEKSKQRHEINDDGDDGRVLERGGPTLSTKLFKKSIGCKQAMKTGHWVDDDANNTSSKTQRSTAKGPSSNPVEDVTDGQSTSSEQRENDNHGSKGQDNLDDAILGTMEVDVVGMSLQPGTVEVDVIGTPSDNEMEIEGAAPSKDGPITSQTQVQSVIEDTSHKAVESVKVRKEEKPRAKTKNMVLTVDKTKKVANKKDTTGNITMETPRHSQPPFQTKKKSPELYSQEYLSPSSSNCGTVSTTGVVSSTSKSPLTGQVQSTKSNLSSVTTRGGFSNVGPPKQSKDTSVPQSGPSNSSLSTSKSPLTTQTVLFSKDISKSQDPSDLSGTRSRDLFMHSNPSSNNGPSNTFPKNKSPSTSTRGKAPSSVNPTKKQNGASVTQISLNVLMHNGPSRSSSPPSSERSHSRSTTPPSSTTSRAPPECEPRVIDPVYHHDPQLERWRQIMQAHWFEVKMLKSRQPLTMAEKRGLKQFGLLDDHIQ